MALALTLLAAELYNILAFHITLSPNTIAPALVACALWGLVYLQHRESFKGILAAKPVAQGIIPIAARRDQTLLAADWEDGIYPANIRLS